MCGIAGVFGDAAAGELARAMAAGVAHRGPDGAGACELEPGAAVAHRRLAVLDCSPRGAQPMRSRDGRWTLVFNGEIFNYRELGGELAGGLNGGLEGGWRTATDTEVLLEAIARWGVAAALRASVGMFALAAWDHHQRELTLARDRVGEKPLVYFWDGRRFAFASEMKALGRLHQRRLEPRAVDLYLALGYVPAPVGIFAGTAKLEAGHWLRYRPGRGPGPARVEVQRWWHPEYSPAALPPQRNQRIAALRAKIGDAVALRLRSDVPVALALSGGIDSSVLACELAGADTRPDAFTVVFDGDETDLEPARTVARRFGFRHQVLRAEGGGLEDRLEAMLEQYDEPFADSSAIASLSLARALGGRYKVVLTGDGGDEAFAGYPHYEFIAAKQVVKAAAARAGFADGSGASRVYVASKTTFRAAERRRLLALAPAGPAGLAPGSGGSAGAMSSETSGAMSAPGSGALEELLDADGFLAAQPRSGERGALKRALWSDRHLYLANDLTYKMDLALAAHGMEGRAPLLDHRVLEWAQRLENRELVRGRQKKVLLRAAYSGELPRGILDRPKHGFGAPVASWLAGPLRGEVAAALPCPLLEAPPAGPAAFTGQRLWTLFVFARWAAKWRAAW